LIESEPDIADRRAIERVAEQRPIRRPPFFVVSIPRLIEPGPLILLLFASVACAGRQTIAVLFRILELFPGNKPAVFEQTSRRDSSWHF
jgi:hypothetical protein